MQVADKLSRLRRAMAEEGIDAYVVANADAHHNEQVADRWKSREWLIHLKASAGTVLVTANWCGFWVDSRYYEAAEEALAGTEVELMRASDVDCPSLETWIKTHLPEGSVFGFFGGEVDESQARTWKASLRPAGYGISTRADLIERVWTDRPPTPQGRLFLVPERFTGESTPSKLERVRQKMTQLKIDAHLLGRTDESCWLFNFRGTDQAGLTTPYCHTLITTEEVIFFIDPAKLDAAAREHFERCGVTLRDYDEVEAYLEALAPTTRLLMVPGFTSHALYQAADQCVRIKERALVTDLKGIKNATEIARTREALLDDGAVLARFGHWLETTLRGGEVIGEYDCRSRLIELRSEVEGYRHESFEAIVGYASHGALNHYSVTPESSKTLEPRGLLLVDSGGNYLHGVTDTTRVFALGEVSAEEKADYTEVLKALITLLDCEFIEGTTGAQLDGVCRASLWASRRHYGHGTGHGVGFGLEVHEGPQSISTQSREKMRPGQLTTIEPGCYRPGRWGVRLENMVHTEARGESDFGRFLGFENLTFCPFDPRCVEVGRLDDRQLAWFNAYQAAVQARLAPKLEAGTRRWLEATCAPLSRGDASGRTPSD